MAAAARQDGTRRSRGPRPRPVPAASLPVGRVAVDIPLPHLDRPFDYLIPAALSDAAVTGCRVRIRFAGRLTGGFLLERAAASEHPGNLSFLQRVVSAEPVLSAEVAGLSRAVADRYGGTLADVLRLAIPPRHARAEQAGTALAGAADGAGQSAGAVGLAAVGPPEAGPWSRYPAGASFLAALADGRAPRAVWSALPGDLDHGPAWPQEIALAVAATVAAGKGALVVVPDVRDLALVDAALSRTLGPGRHVSLAAQLGPAERYRRWLAISRGAVRVAAGTRAAMFAPVPSLGLVVLWDEGDDLHAEPRAPYPHAREVLALRAHRCAAAALIGGFARTAEAEQLVAAGWARSVQSRRATVRACAPLVSAAGGDAELARDPAARTARLPSLALRTARDALARGPVLFQVPRRGYVAALGCERCGARLRCDQCGGPVSLPRAQADARCGWCASAAAARCPACGHGGLRALVTGAGRTAEELARAFPAVPVLTSGRAEIIESVPAEPAVVVATPGAEPRAEGGYPAAVLLDGWALLGRASLRAGEEALRRWMNAAALVRPGPAGGTVIVVADAGLAAVQAMIRWDPVTHAEHELAERRELRFPPAARMASVSGPADAVAELLRLAELPEAAEVLGPVPIAVPGNGAPDGGQENVRFLIRVPRSGGSAMAAALRAGQAVRSAHKDAGQVRLQLDPAELI